MLKGHAKIELTNVKTGAKQVIEHDNMLTNYYRDLFTPHGIFGKSVTHAGGTWNKSEFFGGIVLYENALDNDADNYQFPHGNKMIAHGSNIAYSGADTTLGSFNSAESVIGADSATLVWDWTQERGNGTISALGLASSRGGLIGGGTAGEGDVSDVATVIPDTLRLREAPNIGGNQSYLPLYVDVVNNKMYGAYYSSNTLYVREYQFAETGMDLLTLVVNFAGSSVQDLMQNVSTYIDKTVDLTAYGYGNNPPVGHCYQGKLYMTSGTSNWASGNRTFVRYDFATGVIDTITVANNTGETIAFSYYQVQRTGLFAIHEGCLYAVTTANHYVYINLSDNTDCGTIEDGNGDTITRTSGSSWGNFVRVWGELFLSKNSTSGATDANSRQMYVLDSKSVAKRRNIRPFTNNTYEFWTNVETNNSNKVVGFVSATAGVLYRTFNLMCLATKNNLDTAVTKTADMTMRVTYTIREVSE